LPNLSKIDFAPAIEAIHQAQNIVICCHVNPDGDTLGSMVALGLGLQSLGKSVTMLSSDGVPAIYAFMKPLEHVQITTDRRDFDLAIVVDAGEVSRTGKNAEVALATPLLMDIDHHVTANVFGDIRLLDGTASATAEIIYDLLGELKIPLTTPIAELLLCGILTDTGSFRYKSTTQRTMQIGGDLIAHGAVPDVIFENVYENKTLAAQKILGKVLDALQVSENGLIAWSHVTQADFVALGATDSDTEGGVNAVRAVQGVLVAMFFREMANGKIRISLRAKDPVGGQIDVSKVAAQFNGGGHRLASGCSFEGSLADAESALLEAVQEILP
jgi:bifunctional oligoribonuclease and PAP phosphatase NrnA